MLVRCPQVLSTRARGAVEAADVAVRVCVFVFDLLFCNGASAVGATLRDRRAALAAALPGLGRMPGRLEWAASQELCAQPAEEAGEEGAAGGAVEGAAAGAEVAEGAEVALRTLLAASVAASCEGLMLKRLDSRYEPGRRSDCWVKLKKDYCSDLADSLDLVPIGAWHGSGRKAGWLSPFLMAAYDPVREEYSSVCRVMSGFSDALYRSTAAFYRGEGESDEADPTDAADAADDADAADAADRMLPAKPPHYVTHERPDFWLRPLAVWEIRGADLSLSPVHLAAQGADPSQPGRGVSLRFPRFVRVRGDRAPEDASGPELIAQLFWAQSSRQRGGGAGAEGGAAVGERRVADGGDRSGGEEEEEEEEAGGEEHEEGL